MNKPLAYRIQSLDFLKGVVMVIMALDHIRDYFHQSAFLYDPCDIHHTTIPIFFTRWITHFCAPLFCFLAGTSAFFIGMRKSKRELSVFLLKRGLWLIFLEVTVITFAWHFDLRFRILTLQTIWSLGVGMIVLAGLIYLPRTAVLIWSCALIAGHNAFDGISGEENILRSLLHTPGIFSLGSNLTLEIVYPIVPWIAVMSLGYCFGVLYEPSFEPRKRKIILNSVAGCMIVFFIVLRAGNFYGDPLPRENAANFSEAVLSFFVLQKYPPSLFFLLMTLGLSLLLLANMENVRNRFTDVFSMFGRVPFFYYVAHLYLIHFLALLAAEIFAGGWRQMIFTQVNAGFLSAELKGYGFDLSVVYALWLAITALLYPLCKKYDDYKQRRKDLWWLSYL